MRRAYIDWLRGIAVLLMIMWHSIDAWTLATDRGGQVFKAVVFLAGWPAPLFLFLAGVSQAFAGTSQMRRGLSRRDAGRALRRRAWQVFLIAHLFRFQSFFFNPSAPWSDLFRPDILNVLGLGLVATGYLWTRATVPRAAVWWLLLPAIAAAAIAPWAQAWSWPALLPAKVEAYIRPVGDNGVFSLFPTVAFVIGGSFVGVCMSAATTSETVTLRWLGLVGAGVLAVVNLVAIVPGPGVASVVATTLFVASRCAAMTVAIVLSWLLIRHRPAGRWSPMLTFGRTSLFVYWVHVELAYGAVSTPLHHALPFRSAVVAYGCLTLVMLGIAEIWVRRLRPSGPLVPVHMRAPMAA